MSISPIAPDAKREIYSKYAKQYIPRNYVLNAEGKIIFASTGFQEKELENMIAVIDKEIKKAKSSGL